MEMNSTQSPKKMCWLMASGGYWPIIPKDVSMVMDKSNPDPEQQLNQDRSWNPIKSRDKETIDLEDEDNRRTIR